MPDPATVRAVQSLEQAIRALQHTMAEGNALARLNARTTWGMPELRAKFAGQSEDQIKALLERHCGYQGQVGQRLSVTIDQVLKLEAIITRRLVVQEAGRAHAS